MGRRGEVEEQTEVEPLHPKFESLIPFSALSFLSLVPSLPTGLIEGEIDSSVR